MRRATTSPPRGVANDDETKEQRQDLRLLDQELLPSPYRKDRNGQSADLVFDLYRVTTLKTRRKTQQLTLPQLLSRQNRSTPR